MSTPCMIFMDTPIRPKSIYCHYDGMLENTGLILYHHYNDEEKVKELIDKGDNSGLQPNIEDIAFYGKHTDANIKDYDTVYLFRNNQWFVKIPNTLLNRCQTPVHYDYDNELFEPLEHALQRKQLI